MTGAAPLLESVHAPLLAPQPVPLPGTLLAIADLSIALPAGADRPYAAENVTFSIAPGEIVCLVGESGSGKSMIAHAILALLPRGVAVAGGALMFEGQDVKTLAPRALRRLRGGKISMIFQEPLNSLNPLKRIGAQIAEAITAHDASVAPDDVAARVLHLLEQVGLPDPPVLARSYPFQLSGGQRQRVMIATAMANGPALLIADEPTTALDVTTQAQILSLIDRLRRTNGMGTLLITHDFGVVASVADRVVVMREGRVVEQGRVADVLRQPREPYTRALIAAVPKGVAIARTRDRADEPVLSVRGLCKTFTTAQGLFRPPRRVVAAHDISLDLHRGETVAVVGESGSGKSTLGRLIMRLSEPDSGTIRLGDEDLRTLRGEKLRLARRDLQIVFQDPFASLNPRQSVGDAIMRGPLAFGIPRAEAAERMGYLLQRVGIAAHSAQRYPHEFSGGQRQRICIARALAVAPRVLIADEAVSALDVSVQAEVLKLLAELREEMRLAMLFITHDLRVAAEIADRVIVLHRGKIVEQGYTADVFAKPSHPYTRALLDAIPGRGFFDDVDETPNAHVA